MLDMEPEYTSVARYEGIASRFTCEACDAVFYIDDDVSSGEVIVCEYCDSCLVVEGR